MINLTRLRRLEDRLADAGIDAWEAQERRPTRDEFVRLLDGLLDEIVDRIKERA